MEMNANRGIDQERTRKDEDLKLAKNLLDFTAARLPALQWLRKIDAADNTPAA